MSGADVTAAVEQARAAARRGDWPRACALLLEADASVTLSGAELALLADAAYAAGRLDVTIATWERAHARALRAGDHAAAAGAAVRVAMHLLFDTGLMAPVRGWLGRAERLLEGHDETAADAWLGVVASYERLLSGDFEEAVQRARRAIDIGGRRDAAAAAVGRVAEARSIILGGAVSEGLELLNEAAVAAVSGELDPLFTGLVYCEVVCALQALAQHDLAEQWTAAMEAWRQDQPVGSLHGRCRVHRAEILRLRGFCEDAESEAVVACDELRPYLRREFGWPLAELGRIRLRRGDINGAEAALREAHEVGWDAQPGLALVHLARGDGALAVASIRDALEHPSTVPSKELPPNTELRLAPLLEAQVEIELAAGDQDRARTAADRLAHIAAAFDSTALAASAAAAKGSVMLAEGDAAGARDLLEKAVDLWTDIGAPYETAEARTRLAHAYRAIGGEQRATLEFRTAQSTFERIGAVRQAAEAADACSAARRADVSARPESAGATVADRNHDNVFRREGDYWCITFDAHTTRLRDLKGLHYLARLLAAPGREFHVLDLVAAESGAGREARRSAEHDGDVLLDAQAKQAYRRRLAEIEEDIEQARAMADAERAAQAEAERDFLLRELARAVGLGGRDRRTGSTSERARAAVTRAVRHALARIREHHAGLGEHLDHAIRTGTWCAYVPDPRLRTVWEL